LIGINNSSSFSKAGASVIRAGVEFLIAGIDITGLAMLEDLRRELSGM
jgi:hypothetical protein